MPALNSSKPKVDKKCVTDAVEPLSPERDINFLSFGLILSSDVNGNTCYFYTQVLVVLAAGWKNADI
jgi:hypothetical protein